jgi:hypothetical protein
MITSALFFISSLCRNKAPDSKQDFDYIKPVTRPFAL